MKINMSLLTMASGLSSWWNQTPANLASMLAGTKAEIEEEIKRLGLKEKLTREEKIDRRRAELQAKHEIRQGQQDVIDEK